MPVNKKRKRKENKKRVFEKGFRRFCLADELSKSRGRMADAAKKNEASKVYEIVEEDDEFEEFEDEGWMDRKEELEDKHYWADDWDNDDMNEEFAAQLRQELAATAK
jgi:26 proteasome complex subunit DSS1